MCRSLSLDSNRPLVDLVPCHTVPLLLLVVPSPDGSMDQKFPLAVNFACPSFFGANKSIMCVMRCNLEIACQWLDLKENWCKNIFCAHNVRNKRRWVRSERHDACIEERLLPLGIVVKLSESSSPWCPISKWHSTCWLITRLREWHSRYRLILYRIVRTAMVIPFKIVASGARNLVLVMSRDQQYLSVCATKIFISIKINYIGPAVRPFEFSLHTIYGAMWRQYIRHHTVMNALNHQTCNTLSARWSQIRNGPVHWLFNGSK